MKGGRDTSQISQSRPETVIPYPRAPALRNCSVGGLPEEAKVGSQRCRPRPRRVQGGFIVCIRRCWFIQFLLRIRYESKFCLCTIKNLLHICTFKYTAASINCKVAPRRLELWECVMRSELAVCHHTPDFNPCLLKEVRLWSLLLRARFVRCEPGLRAVLATQIPWTCLLGWCPGHC